MPLRLSPFRLLTAAALVTLVGAYALAGCQSTDVAVADDEAWTYVGDAACASCHADLAVSYARTGMGRSLSRFDPATAPEQFDAEGRSPVVCAPRSGYCYQALLRGDTLFQRETHPDWPGHDQVVAAAYVVGSGHATRSYLAASDAPAADSLEAGAYLTEMPLTWYVERELWDLSPGYTTSNSRFDRPITLECLTCHDGRPGHAESQNFYTHVPLGIGCERCHGPGSAHVAAFEAGGAPEASLIVNPATLPTSRQIDVCQQCHLTGQTVYADGEDPTTYRPGRPLAAHRAVFVTDASLEDPEAFGISSHAERLMQSACFEESAGTDRPMTCTTCHDPHVPTAELPRDHMAAACQSCHGPSAHQAACSRPGVTVAEAATGDCASCHMRRAGTSDIPHVSFTDHWIRRRPPPNRTGGPEGDAEQQAQPFRLVDLTRREAGLEGERDGIGTSAQADLDLGEALFGYYEQAHPLRAYLPLAAARLRAGLAAGADRPSARVALGRALLEMDSLAAAERILAEAAERAPQHAAAHLWLGVVRLDRGDARGAVGALREAVRRAPRLTEARGKLAQALAQSGQMAAAADELAVALAADPFRFAGDWNNLGLYRLQMGDAAAATAALRRSVALDPREPTARANLGTALLAGGDLAAAAAQFEAALRLDATSEAALGNLGIVRAEQGRTEDARRLFQRLLALNPADARAAAYLATL